jgi:chromosomal replication initiation ATPase DnaA
MGGRRDRHFARPRQILCYLIHELRPGLGIARVGRFMHRDHSTVIYAIKTIRKMLEDADEDVVQIYQDAKQELGA